MDKTWRAILKGGKSYRIEGITLDFERGIPFIDDFENAGNFLVLKEEFLVKLVEQIRSNEHYVVFKGLEVISPEGDNFIDQEIELGVVLAFSKSDRIIGFLYNITENGLEILGLYPFELMELYKTDEKRFLDDLLKLIVNPFYFKGVTFLFPEYYPY